MLSLVVSQILPDAAIKYRGCNFPTVEASVWKWMCHIGKAWGEQNPIGAKLLCTRDITISIRK